MTDQDTIKARPGGLRVIETEGDIFDAPENSVLVHAVNCQGLWGAGIAEAFKSKYPVAFEVYKLHCKDKSKLPGTCLLIPPQLKDYESSLPEEDELGARGKRHRVTAKASTKKHWVGCLFTSYSFGKPTKFKAGKDPPEKILSYTRSALKDLRQQVERLDAGSFNPAQRGTEDGREEANKTSGEDTDRGRATDEDSDKVDTMPDAKLGPLYACKFNSGSFGVEWRDTRALIEEAFEGSDRVMRIISPSSQVK